MQNREVEILAKGREADFGMNEFPSGGSKLSYRGFGILPPFTGHSTVGTQLGKKCRE